MPNQRAEGKRVIQCWIDGEVLDEWNRTVPPSERAAQLEKLVRGFLKSKAKPD